MYSKCIFVAISLAFFAAAFAEDAVSDGSTKDNHEKYLFNSTDEKNLTLFTFDVKTINVKLSADKKDSTFNSFNPKLDSKMIPAKQNVNETFQDYTLFLNVNYSLTFSFLREGESYNLSMIEFSHNKNTTTDVFRVEDPDLKLTKNTFKRESQGYKCGNLKYTLKLDDSNSTAEIELTDISFIAFQNSFNNKKPSFLECRQEPGSSVVPLAVGGGLLVFMGIALVVYIFMRNRSS